MTDRELITHCANQLELTTTSLPYEFILELVRRLTAHLNDAPIKPRTGVTRHITDPEED